MKRNAFILVLVICYFTSYGQQTGTFTDPRDGKVYKTIIIGTQTWMAENLAYKASSGCWVYDNDQSNVMATWAGTMMTRMQADQYVV